MSKIKNTLALSLAHSTSPEASYQRRADILKLPFIRGTGALALHTAAVRRPELIGRLFGIKLNQDVEFVAAGSDSAVYRWQNTVLKASYISTGMTDEARRELAERKNLQHKSMANYMASFVLDQTIYVGSHPIAPVVPAVITEQSFFDLDHVGIFVPESAYVDDEELMQADQKFPGFAKQLLGFVTVAQALHSDTGLLPDTYGPNNIAVIHNPEPQLVIVDGQPLTVHHQLQQECVLEQFRELESVLL